MSDRSVLVRLLANVADFKAQMDSARRSVKGVGDESEKSSKQATTTLGRLTQSAQKNREAWDDAGRAMATAGAVGVVAIGATVKAAIDWESAWAGVTKTVEGTPQQLGQVEDGLRGLARTLPATHDEIAAVAEAAGQLGVKTESVVGFTRTMIDLGETTNLSADVAATSLAQLMNVMQTAPDDVGRLGAALVALGNDGASTEADIVNMASYITGSAKLIGASESDVLALANAMTSMGINAERGGGVMTRVMQDVYAAVQTGGARLEGFAKTAGMSSAEFARAFEADPIRAIDSFIRGLNDVEQSGGNVVATLGDLGYVGTQDTAVLLQMKGAGDLLTESLDLGSEAWEQNTALVEEAAKRYDTTASKLALARNNINDAAIEIGEVFLPVLGDLADGLADVAGGFADLPDPIQGAIGGLTVVASAGALAAGGFLLLFPRVIETYRAFQTLRTDMPGVASGLGKVGKAAGIAGIVLSAATAVDALVDSMYPAPASMEETTKALLGMAGSMEQVNGMFQFEGRGFRAEIDGLADAAKRLTDPSFINRVNDFGGSLGSVLTLGAAGSSEGAAEREKILDQLDQMGSSLALMVESGNTELAAEQFKLLSAEWERGGGTVEDLKDLMPAYGEALQGVKNEQELATESARMQAEAAAVLAQDLDIAYGSLGGYAAALGLSEEATEKLIEDSELLGESLAAFIDPLGTYQGLLQTKAQAEADAANATAEQTGASTKSWQDYVTDVSVSFEEYMTSLQEQVKAQEDWQLNMLLLAGRVSAGTLAELSRMGPEGAALVAELVTRSDEELAGYDDVMARRSKEATDAWGAQLTMAAPVLAAIGRTAGQGVVDELAAKLAAGTITIAEIARQYGISLAGGINPVLTALGKRAIQPVDRNVAASGNGQMGTYADGGFHENHVAQFAKPGDWRVWAEPETGGEAYIPLAASKRGRSVDIWRETGRRLGVDLQEFAFGGISDVPKPPSTAPFGPPLSTAADAAMQKVYGDTVDWLKTNLAPNLGPGIGYQAMMSALRTQFPGLALNSGFRPGSITATGNLSYHAKGRAVDVPPRMDVFNWIAEHYPNSRELIFSPAGGRQIWNGRPHLYGEPTRGDHWDHNHWAMRLGGILDFYRNGGVSGQPGSLLNPHIRDAGGPLLPGYTFNGTGASETVVANQRFLDAYGSGPAGAGGTREIHHHHAYEVKAQLTGDPDANARQLLRRMAKAERQAMAGVPGVR